VIRIKTNITQVVAKDVGILKKLADTDQMLRTAATTVLGMLKVRVHQEGLDADNKRIGTYSPGYMKVRTGIFNNSLTSKTGKLKDAGVFTRGKSKGAARPRYNRTNDTKVIASLTRQMESDEKVIAITKGYGIGFSNPLNYNKSQWVEATYNRKGKIFAMSDGEVKSVNDIAQKFVDNAISGLNS
jgi:hypothetical protein